MSMNQREPGGVPRWTITDRLRKAREDANLTQKQLAQRADIALRTISNYENPTYDKARRPVYLNAWALACGVPIDWLRDGTNPTLDDPGGLEVSGSGCYAKVIPFRRARAAHPLAVAS